jgi:secretion/DNA translocation related TadE-like protein
VSDAGTRQRGAVTVLMLAVLVIGVVLVTGVSRLGGAMIGRARAAAAADAAALAAADALASGRGAAAAVADARATAATNDARLVSCACAGTDASVVVEVDLPAFVIMGGIALGRARAEIRPECMLDLPECR